MVGFPINRLGEFNLTFVCRSFRKGLLPVERCWLQRRPSSIRQFHRCNRHQQEVKETEEARKTFIGQTANILFRDRGRADMKRNLKSFGFMFDIDGVLVRGRRVIPAAATAIKKVLRLNIPTIFLTNGGCETEEHKARVLSTQLHHKVAFSFFIK